MSISPFVYWGLMVYDLHQCGESRLVGRMRDRGLLNGVLFPKP